MATCINDFQKTVIVADGVSTLFAVQGAASTNAANYRVDMDGVLQEPDTDYTIDSNGNISFTSVPPTGAKIVIIADSTDATIFVPGQPLQNISPNAPEITTILRTECIGNSLTTINGNFANLRQAICTIDNFVAAANIKINQLDSLLGSITNAQLARAFVTFNGTRDADGIADVPGSVTVTQRQLIQKYKVNNVVRNSVGSYTVSFDLGTFSDEKYLMIGSARFPNIVTYSSTVTTQDSMVINVMDNDRNLVDVDLISLVFYNN